MSTEPTNSSSRSSILQNALVKRVMLYAAVLLFVFLLGFIPMWLTARSRAQERDQAQSTLRISTLQNTLANAAIDARRGEYEPARQAASDFFTRLNAEIELGRQSVFSETQQKALSPVFSTRDDTITLLARNDPASVEKLFEIYNTFRQAIAGARPN